MKQVDNAVKEAVHSCGAGSHCCCIDLQLMGSLCSNVPCMAIGTACNCLCQAAHYVRTTKQMSTQSSGADSSLPFSV